MKKIFAGLLAAAISLSCAASVFADAIHENVEVFLNGEKQEETITLTEIDDSVLIPIRPVWNLFNMKLSWDGMRKRITSSTALGKTVIGIGSVMTSVNGNAAYVASTYPRIFGGSTMIPIDLAEACTGASVKYVQSNNSLVVTRE